MRNFERNKQINFVCFLETNSRIWRPFDNQTHSEGESDLSSGAGDWNDQGRYAHDFNA